MRTTITLAAAVTLASMTGCAGPFTDVTKMDVGYNAPSDPNKVQILYLKPDGKYQEVAAVVTEGWDLNDVAKMHNALRDKVSSTGATAVVLQYPYFTYGFFGARYLGYTGVAIKR